MIIMIVENRRIPNALIDGGSRANIITNTLRKKLGLKKIKPTPFSIKMVDQRKVSVICTHFVNDVIEELTTEFKIKH